MMYTNSKTIKSLSKHSAESFQYLLYDPNSSTECPIVHGLPSNFTYYRQGRRYL